MVGERENHAREVSPGAGTGTPVALPVLAARAPRTRRSRAGRWRAWTLLAVHLAMIAHVAHWLATGRTLSPVEPSEAMYTLNSGQVNAGFVFFVLAIIATLVFGRFVCGWGCHFIAYQDMCAWALKKVGIKPRPFRSRFVVLAPLALAIYMFIWPSAFRWWSGIPRPGLTNHIFKTAFWETFPGPLVAILTVVLCGFVIVYFLGAKGFCTYACPYGAFFGLAGKVSAGRILVSDACEHCGHCTANCTSNVRVHEEVARYGMVVDPGCMKCLDCISVCPNDALHFGFSRPSAAATTASTRRRPGYDLSLWEEILFVVIGVAALLAFRGLYGHIPLLMAVGLGAMTAYVSLKSIHLFRRANVRLQNLQLKLGGRLTRGGAVFLAATTAWAGLAAHSAAVQYEVRRGGALFDSLALGDEVWSIDESWWDAASEEQRATVDAAIAHLERAERWGVLTSDAVLTDLTWLYLARDRLGDAEHILRRLIARFPGKPEPHRGLAGVLRKAGRVDEAVEQFRRALAIDATHAAARAELCATLSAAGRFDEAVETYREATNLAPDDQRWPLELARLFITLGRFVEARDELDAMLDGNPDSARGHMLLGLTLAEMGEGRRGLEHLRRATELAPQLGEAHYNLGMVLLKRRNVADAIRRLRRAVELDPNSPIAHYNLGVAVFMSGRPAEAIAPVKEAIRLAPDDPDSHGFLAVILRELGDVEGARAATSKADQLRRRERD